MMGHAEAKADALAAELARLHRHRFGLSDGCCSVLKAAGKAVAPRAKSTPWST